jgi:hypothetical protein
LLNQESLLALVNDVDQDRVRRDLVTFFGPRAEGYLQTYEKIRAGANRHRTFPMSWNWAVFLGSFVWFFFRKMYLWGAALIVLPIILGLVIGGTGGGGTMFAFALFAKPLYVHTALARISKANQLSLTGAERDDYLRRAGGVSIVAGVLAGILYAALLAMLILSAVNPSALK